MSGKKLRVELECRLKVLLSVGEAVIIIIVDATLPALMQRISRMSFQVVNTVEEVLNVDACPQGVASGVGPLHAYQLTMAIDQREPGLIDLVSRDQIRR